FSRKRIEHAGGVSGHQDPAFCGRLAREVDGAGSEKIGDRSQGREVTVERRVGTTRVVEHALPAAGKSPVTGLGHDAREIHAASFDARETAVAASEEIDPNASGQIRRGLVLPAPGEEAPVPAVEPTVERAIQGIPPAPGPDHRAGPGLLLARSVGEADSPAAA